MDDYISKPGETLETKQLTNHYQNTIFDIGVIDPTAVGAKKETR